MKGCRPLTDVEATLVASKLTTLRDRCMFVVGCRTGLRISELVSVRLEDVTSNSISVTRQNTKGKIEGCTIPLHADAKEAISIYLASRTDSNPFLFPSEKGGHIGRVQGFRILQAAYAAAGLEGKVASHSMRKTFANKIYTLVKKDILLTAKALRHKQINSTMSYLSFSQEAVDNAILAP